MTLKDLVIIGTGPSGLTAAIYASRANIDLLVIEGKQPGGQLTTTTEVENFPGFPEGISGPELMANMKNQAEKFGTFFENSIVTAADLSERPFKITLENGKELKANSLIISTGATAKYLGLENEQRLIGQGVSGCATCDGFFYRDKIVHVVGGGDTAMEEAMFLTKFASKVFIVHRRGELRASKPMQDRVLNNSKIEMVWNSQVVEILEDTSGVTGLVVENTETKERTNRETHGLFLGIGHSPATSFLNGQIKLDQNGFIVTAGTKTSIEGVFSCGDVQDPTYRQAITSAGTGCQAAIDAEHFLQK